MREHNNFLQRNRPLNLYYVTNVEKILKHVNILIVIHCDWNVDVGLSFHLQREKKLDLESTL